MTLKKLEEITIAIKQLITSVTFLEKSRQKTNQFTRLRKLSFVLLIKFLLNLSSRSLQIEIDSFLEKITGDDNMDCTKQAVSKARANISYESFKLLNTTLINSFYEDGNYKRYKGYRLLSIDGTSLKLPNISKLKEEFGVYHSKSTEAKTDVPAARASVLYDNLNNIILDSKIDIYKSSERTHAKAHLEELISINKGLNIDNINDLVIFDRGYPSLKLMYFMKHFGSKYLFRITHSFLKETNAIIKEGSSKEKIVTIKLSKRKITASNLTEINPNVKYGDTLTFKLVIITLESGAQEYLITNAIELSYEELKEIYHIRWKIETCYDELKNKLELENFSGLSSNSIKQDFYSSIFIFNYASLVSETAQTEYDLELSETEKKYAYKINKNMVLGYLKDKIIDILFKDNVLNVLKSLIRKSKKNMTAIKNGRTFERNKENKPKFSIFRKRCL